MLKGLIDGEASLAVDSQLNLTMSGKAAVGFPEATPFVGGMDFLDGQFQLIVINDGVKHNDYLTATVTADLPLIDLIQVGFKVNFAGEYQWIGLDQLFGGNGSGEGETPALHYFTVPAGKAWTLFGAEWVDGPAGSLVLTTPDGVSLSEQDIATRSDMAIVPDMSNSRRRVVVVRSPQAGSWGVGVDSNEPMGEITYYAHANNHLPTVAVTDVVGVPGARMDH